MFVRRDGKVVKRLIQCCSLNGGVFLFSLILFENVILPCLEYLLAVLFGESLSEFLWSWIFPILSWTFGTLWVMPLFLLSKIVNSLWFQVKKKKIIANLYIFINLNEQTT